MMNWPCRSPLQNQIIYRIFIDMPQSLYIIRTCELKVNPRVWLAATLEFVGAYTNGLIPHGLGVACEVRQPSEGEVEQVDWCDAQTSRGSYADASIGLVLDPDACQNVGQKHCKTCSGERIRLLQGL